MPVVKVRKTKTQKSHSDLPRSHSQPLSELGPEPQSSDKKSLPSVLVQTFISIETLTVYLTSLDLSYLKFPYT